MCFLLQWLEASVDRPLSTTPPLPLDHKGSTLVQLGVTATYNPTSQFRVETVAQRGYADTSDGAPSLQTHGALL